MGPRLTDSLLLKELPLDALEGIETGDGSGRPKCHRVTPAVLGGSGLPKAGLRALRNSV